MTDKTQKISRGFEFALFGTAMLFAMASLAIANRAAHGIALKFRLDAIERLLAALFLIFLVWLGFSLLDWVATPRDRSHEVIVLPRRPGWMTEWSVGAAIGWALSLATALPLLLSANLHAHLRFSGDSVRAAVIGVLTLLAVTLATELIARGYGFQRLIAALGPTWAALLTSLGFSAAMVWSDPPEHLGIALINGVLFGIVLSMAYLRTHALWVGWGLHFLYRAVAAILLGLPVAGRGEFSSILDTYTTGPQLLTGGRFGLDASPFTAIVLLGGMAVLYRATRDYAWRYTHREIVAGGYEVTVAPPAAHVAMEKAAATPALVQILPTTPRSGTATDTARNEGM